MSLGTGVWGARASCRMLCAHGGASNAHVSAGHFMLFLRGKLLPSTRHKHHTLIASLRATKILRKPVQDISKTCLLGAGCRPLFSL